MAHPKVRADGVVESLMHIACAVTVVVVYILAGFVGDAAVAATRYMSG